MGREVVVVGGGFSGLCMAHFLSERGCSVSLYEKSDHLGGLIESSQMSPHGLVESAANSLVYTLDVKQLIEEVKAKPVFPLPENKKRFIYRDGARRCPLTSAELAIFAKDLVFYVLKKKPAPLAFENLDDFLTSHFDRVVVDYLVAPFLSGIYGLFSRELSANLIFQSVMSKKGGRKIVSFSGGMSEFIGALSGSLKEAGVKFFLNEDFRVKERVKVPHVFCTSASSTSEILSSTYADLSGELSHINMISLVTVTAFFEKDKNDLKGFGCLFPEKENFSSLGVLFNECIFQGRSEKRSETWILNVRPSTKGFLLDRKEVLQTILNDRRRAFGQNSTPVDVFIKFWPQSLPAYDASLERVRKNFEKLPKNIYLCGNYVQGIGLSSIVSLCKKTAQKIEF